MSSKLSKNQLEKYSRQIILKNIGVLGQKKILNSRVLVIGSSWKLKKTYQPM